ncbi:hypothetical protein [Micromonospora rubida]
MPTRPALTGDASSTSTGATSSGRPSAASMAATRPPSVPLTRA